MARKKQSLLELINPSPKQKVAFEKLRTHKFLLYGGAMYGGKSYWLRWALIALLVHYFKKYKLRNVVAGLFCEDYPSLKDRHLSKISSEFPEWLGEMHSDHKNYGKSFVLAPEYGGGVIAFRNLDDPSKYASAEFAAIAVDELTKNPIETFTALRHRLRWPQIKDCKFIAGTNPGSIGHIWVKKYWMDRDFPPEEEEKEQFVYVPAKYSDNPYINPDYERTLNSLPPKQRKAFRDGDWDIFAGQYFDEWSREHNTCNPFVIPKHWMRFLWLDYGYTAPSAVYWAALDEVGRVYVYRELYVKEHTYNKLARKIEEKTPEEEREMLEGNMVADPAIFSKVVQGKELAKSGAEEMQEATKGWLIFRKGNNDRIIGWGIMRQYMKSFKLDGKTTSKLIYFNTCRNAIRTIPAMVHDSTKPEDIDTLGEDHAADSTRYGLMDIYELMSEKPKVIKKVRTTDDIFEDDMKAMREEEERKENDIDWMSI